MPKEHLRPDAMLTRPERESPHVVLDSAAQADGWLLTQCLAERETAFVHVRFAGLSHNGLRALLGVWQS